MKRRFVFAALLALCAGILAFSPIAHETAGATAFQADTAKIDWAKMTHAQKKDYMKKVVSKKMEAEFAKFDSKKYADMNCSTCHGKESVKKDSFKMPNPDLPKLPKDPVKFREKMASKKEMTSFMMKTVKPEMAEMLGLQEMTMQNKDGFGCHNCHTTE